MDPTTSQDPRERSRNFLIETDRYIRENPVHAVLAGLGIGIALGLLSRVFEPPSRKREPLHEAMDELRAMLATGAKKGRKAYDHSADVVREAVDKAVEKARDIDVDPVAKWWKRLWA